LNAHPENKKCTVKPTVHANTHDNFYDRDQCRKIFSIHEIKMKKCRLNKWQGKINICSKLTWSLSNSFSSTACAPNARMVVRPCNDALRWENTGLRAETSSNINLRTLYLEKCWKVKITWQKITFLRLTKTCLINEASKFLNSH